MHEFYEALWGATRSSLNLAGKDAYGELRLMHGKQVEQSFFRLNFGIPSGDIEEVVKVWGKGADCYFGVLPRVREGGKNEDCPHYTYTLWADIDNKKSGGLLNALSSLSQLEIAPNIIVNSGGGVHAYWLLQTAVPVGEAAEWMKVIADKTNGDHVQDAARVLRCPGSFNQKYPDLPAARILRLDTTKPVRSSDARDAFSPAPVEAVARRGYVYSPPDEYAFERYANYDPGKGNRSEYIWKFCCDAFEDGWEFEQVLAFMLDHWDGVGAKLADMSPTAAESYMHRTWAKVLKLEGERE